MAFYTDGVISIPNVTGDIVITATAVAQAPHYTNLADPTSPNWKTNHRVNSSGSIVAYAGAQVTNAIYVNQGDIIRIKNCGPVTAWAYAVFEGETTETGGVILNMEASYDATTGIATKTVGAITNHWLRFTLSTNEISGEIIITKNEEIPS